MREPQFSGVFSLALSLSGGSVWGSNGHAFREFVGVLSHFLSTSEFTSEFGLLRTATFRVFGRPAT